GPRSPVSRAWRYVLRRPPTYPFACFMVFLWRRRVFGPPFARGMARLLSGGCRGDHGGCGERSGGCERGARSSLLRRAFRHASSVVAALPALAPRLTRLARHRHPGRYLADDRSRRDRLVGAEEDHALAFGGGQHHALALHAAP